MYLKIEGRWLAFLVVSIGGIDAGDGANVRNEIDMVRKYLKPRNWKYDFTCEALIREGSNKRHDYNETKILSTICLKNV